MSCRWSLPIPQEEEGCLDCEMLAPDTCAEHHPVHGDHDVSIKFEDGVGGYYCNTCGVWGKDWERG